MFSLQIFRWVPAQPASQPDIKVSAVRPDLHIEIITGGKGAVVGKEEEGGGGDFKCRGGGLQTETAVQ